MTSEESRRRSASQPAPEPAGPLAPRTGAPRTGAGETAGTGTDAGDLHITDPKMMRALAHPVRMALLDLLSVSETLTATQASEALGESPANCAFHLRTLAKYGFVREAGGGRGRERPWASARRKFSVSSDRLTEPSAKQAAETLGHVVSEQWIERIRRFFFRDSWPAGWEDAAWSSRSLDWLTPDEARELGAGVRRLIDQYAARQADPSLRPAGALPFEFMSFGYPRDELADLNKTEHDEIPQDQHRDIS